MSRLLGISMRAEATVNASPLDKAAWFEACHFLLPGWSQGQREDAWADYHAWRAARDKATSKKKVG